MVHLDISGVVVLIHSRFIFFIVVRKYGNTIWLRVGHFQLMDVIDSNGLVTDSSSREESGETMYRPPVILIFVIRAINE